METLITWPGGKRSQLDMLTDPLRYRASYASLMAIAAARSSLPDRRQITQAWLNEFRINRRPRRVIEGFAGGAALTFALEPETFILCDRSPWLIAFYRRLRDDVEGVIRDWHIDRELHAQWGAMYYKAVRDQDPTLFTDNAAAAWFFYLINSCYNGLWRMSKRKGWMNTPPGDRIREVSDSQLRQVSAFLRCGTVILGDFEEAAALAEPGDLVYFDPPYRPQSKTASFTQYTTEGWTDQDDKRLANCSHNLTSRQVRVMISSADDPAIRALYPGYSVTEVKVRRPVAAAPSSRVAVSEIIMRNWDYHA